MLACAWAKPWSAALGAVADDEREPGLSPHRQGGERDEGEERRRN